MSCPICDDTGWKATTVDGIRRVTRCDCWRSNLTTQLLSEARIPSRYHHCDLATFVTYPNEKLEIAVARARKFAETFPVVDRGLFFIGPPGIGKTHLAVATLARVIGRVGARGLFYDTRELLRLIRSTYNPVVKTAEMDILRPVMEAELLVLDDLGAEKPSEWVEETLNLIVNTRYNERRTTIFTSNYEESSEQSDPDVNSLLFRVGFRMHSRLWEMCDFVSFSGADYRPLGPNPTADELVAHWEQRPASRKLPQAGRHRQARAQLKDGKGDLGWSGGRAGT